MAVVMWSISCSTVDCNCAITLYCHWSIAERMSKLDSLYCALCVVYAGRKGVPGDDGDPGVPGAKGDTGPQGPPGEWTFTS